MKFLFDECLHTSLVAVAQNAGHDGFHINWLGLSGEKDWNLMPRIVAEDYTFVTNNARDFRKLYISEEIHAGLIIIVPQVVPATQRDLFSLILDEIDGDDELLNEVIEISIEGDEAVLTRYSLPATREP
ncbi:MAG TPA: toxin-antitoxin system, toxin component, PIN family protein [Agrobacterium sp.]|nr:toxin-antitoxin system, toxin component, PIN family protein [Agrobacterium sp.]